MGVGRVSDWDEYVASIPRPNLSATRPSKPSDSLPLVTGRGGATAARGVSVEPAAPVCALTHYRPAGSVSDPSGPGYWRVYVEDGEEVAPPF